MNSIRQTLSLVLLIAFANPSLAQDGGEQEEPPANYANAKVAHAVLGILAWVVFFPLGGVIIRLLSRPRTWLIHGLWQLFSYAMFTAAVGLGIWMTMVSDNDIGSYHPIIGLVVFGLVSLEAIGGYVHHLFFKRRNRQTVIAQTHIWLGRILITLGMINGGLGLMFSGEANKGEYIAYGVITGVIWLAYVVYTSFWHVNRPSKEREMLEKQGRGSDIST